MFHTAWDNKFLVTVLWVLMISVSNSQVLGSDDVSEEYSDSAPALEELIIYGSRTDAQASVLPMTTYSLGSEALNLTRHRHISDLLVRSPGVWISRGNGQEHLTALRSPVLTGAGACGAVLMTEDNIPLRAAGFCNVNQLFEATSELAGRIEVLAGPQSVLYGSNALHGVINVVSPQFKAGFEAEPDGKGGGVTSIALESGSYDYYRTRLSHLSKNIYLGFDGVQSGGYKDDAGFDQQKFKFRYNTHLTLPTGELSIITSAALTNLNQETAGFIRGDDAYQDHSRRQENPNPDAYRDARSQRLSVRFDYQADNGTRWVLTPYLRHSEMKFLMHFLPWQPIERNRHYSAGWQSAFQYDVNERLTLHLGLDGEYTRGELQEIQAGDFSPSIPAGTHYDYRVSAQVISPFASLAWQVTDATGLSIGLRYEWLRYDYRNRAGRASPCASDISCRFSRPEDTSDSYNNASWQLGLVHDLNPALQAYANVSRGYRAPQTTELYRLQAGQIGSELNAETSDNIELGLRGHTERWRYSLAAYHMEKEDVIFQNSDRLYISGASTRHQGVELGLRRSLGQSAYVDLNASYAKHRYDSEMQISAVSIKNNDIDTAPRYTGSARIGKRFLGNSRFGESSAELEWVYMGSYYTDPENRHSYRGHRLFNLRWQWQMSPGWQLALRLNNVSDEEYADRADYGFGQERYFVGEPRTGFVELSWQG